MKPETSLRLRSLAAILMALTALPILFGGRGGQAPSAALAPPEADELVVDLRDNATDGDISALESRYNFDLQFNSIYSHEEKLMRVRVPKGRVASLLARLRREPTVEFAEPNTVYQIPPDELLVGVGSGEGEVAPPESGDSQGVLWAPNDPRYKEQWNFRSINMEKAWGTTKGKGAVVAVIDTGVAFEQDDRCYWAKDFKETRFVAGYDFVNDDKHPNDDHGHGTHVAGTIAESTNNNEGVAGIAFEAKIMPLKVLNRYGGGTASDIADAIRYAADKGANVINMSLGSPIPSAVIWSACKYARKKGVVIVCAAGNSGRRGVGYPAAFKECIAVSSVGPTGELAPYSSWGKQIAIAAPGGDKSKGEQYGVLQNTVYQGEDDYYYFNGTSMASPHVAGVAALIISQGVKDPEKVRAILERSAKPKAPKEKYGAGVLNAANAVKLGAEDQGDRRIKFALAALLGLGCLGFGKLTMKMKGAAVYPIGMTVAVALALLAPDWLEAHLGFGSRLNLIGHSLLLPALLLIAGVSSRQALGVLAALAVGLTAHLALDAYHGTAPFAFEVGWKAIPWMWVNIAVGLGVVVAALRLRASQAI